ncbi:Lrp/AsnC family transcriptional regulator [Actinomyces slackii]|uniref:Leucine-responsive regulatory protein n=1 Tax=Actinomyces slackii TaxID=52774 RepID=A0A3S4SFQ8_9ACTO|nr:Lrp/AsnC family transcriptional regulator [Actinomyces slackii]VEG74957.1 Leucine-responsive regulatory protein [Actinomyces slackii]
MDRIDRNILLLLQDDGRLSVTQLASQVGLSLSACHRRLKDLERIGAIQRYAAVVDPRAVGLDFEAVILVTMGRTDAATIRDFENAVQTEPSIVSAQRLFGEPDYLLRVLATDLEDYQRLHDSIYSTLPGVQSLRSTIVVKRIGGDGTVPLLTGETP